MTGFLLVILYFAMAAAAAWIIMQPNRFVVTRSAVIDAPPEQVFPHINDLHNWQAWSPWARLDPNAKNTYEGPAAGAGAAFEWAGDKRVGAGRLTILDSRPFESVDMKLDIAKPFAASNDVSFKLAPEGERTRVAWTMTGPRPAIAKIFNLVMNIDKMCGDQFESGLSNLNALFAR
jgi:carbon monoxide dehydrogenase subunit G